MIYYSRRVTKNPVPLKKDNTGLERYTMYTYPQQIDYTLSFYKLSSLAA